MERSRTTYEELFRVLPLLEDLEPLRLLLAGVAEPDPEREWDRSSAYSTIDKRVVPWSRLERIMGEAEVAAQAHVASVFSRLGPLLSAVKNDRGAEAALQLVALGEYYEGMGMFVQARLCYDAGLAASLPLPNKEPQILALRRIARAGLAMGEPGEAFAYYERSAALAADAGSPRDEVIARTGMGNVLSVQGWLARAEECYVGAFARLESSRLPLTLERGQLCNNLGFVATQQGKFAEAGRWLSEAESLWQRLDSPNDLAICYHNLARLRDREGGTEEAVLIREEAVPLATLPQVLAMITVELADCHLRLGRDMEAERWIRAAEQYAITARTPWVLGLVYQGLGDIARARGAADGFVFYEKALGIARERSLPFLEAETLINYAILRQQTGETDESRSFLERAIQLLDQMGAAPERERASRILATLVNPPMPHTAAAR